VKSKLSNCFRLKEFRSQPATCLLLRAAGTRIRGLLHWLCVPERVKYKLCLLVFKAVRGTAPDYLSELCRSNAEDTARSRLRKAAHGDLQVPRSETDFGDRAFAVAAQCHETDYQQ